MFKKTNPAAVVGLGGHDSERGSDAYAEAYVQILGAHSQLCQEKFLNYGNRCGHDKHVPRRTFLPEHHKPRPSILEEAKVRIHQYYFEQKSYLFNLVFKRSERREAIRQICEVLLHYVCLSTFRIGYYFKDQFNPLSLKQIAEKANLSIYRAKRALADLARAGYLNIRLRYRHENKKYIPEISIRTLTEQFFVDLGFSLKRLAKKRKWKEKKQIELNDKKNLEIYHQLKTDHPKFTGPQLAKLALKKLKKLIE
jgi:AraC-like DNA-binding protein